MNSGEVGDASVVVSAGDPKPSTVPESIDVGWMKESKDDEVAGYIYLSISQWTITQA